MVYHNGDLYDGHWSKGKKHGMGLHSTEHGGTFQGRFKMDLPWDGTMENYIFPNGDHFHGTWLGGKQDVGQFTRASDGRGFVGRFHDNLPLDGVYTRPELEDQACGVLDKKIEEMIERYK